MIEIQSSYFNQKRTGEVGYYLVSVIEIQSSYFNLWTANPNFFSKVSVIEIQSSYFNLRELAEKAKKIEFQWSKSKVATLTSFSITSIVFKPFVRSHKSFHQPAHDYSCKMIVLFN